MSFEDAAVLAGSLSTALFVTSYLPMLVKAGRTRDLSSYSPANLVIANVGNVVYTLYVASLPPGPIWALHSFYVVSSALMLFWWWRAHGRRQDGARETVRSEPDAEPCADEDVDPGNDPDAELAALLTRG